MRLILAFVSGWALSVHAQKYSSSVDYDSLGRLDRVYMLHADTAVKLQIFAMPPDGAEVNFYESGQVRDAFISTLDSRERIWIEWYESGLRKSERIDRANGSKGYFKIWFESGK